MVEGWKGQGQAGGLWWLGGKAGRAVPGSYYRCMEYWGQGAGMRENGGGGKGKANGEGGGKWFFHTCYSAYAVYSGVGREGGNCGKSGQTCWELYEMVFI